eukprot:Gregarina_sp_Pseudo_9__2789@NODE_3022_length_783_cov_30_436828_g2756_i0_p1_GENE_NODE_3022_length_783_cov_30_436828_g2756_i0NODE_3022_length_783_cov_30_436828_g2756_i0_p1_ORF_typecomplete_len149_score18_34_NODE_3022_length_783_cov_30_436828_g2756_i0154600
MLIDVRLTDEDAALFGTALPSSFVDAIAAVAEADRVAGLKYSDCEHLIAVRHSASAHEVLGLAFIAISQPLLSETPPSTEIFIREAHINHAHNGTVIGNRLIQEIKRIGSMLNAQVVCTEQLLSEVFPQMLQTTTPNVTLRTLDCLPS